MKVMIIFFYAGLIAVIIFIVHTLAVQRRKKMAAYAISLGWQFTSEKDKKMHDRYASFKCLRRGHSRHAYNIMRGKRDGIDVTAFDYHYVTGQGKSRRVHNFSALIIQSPLPLRPLYLGNQTSKPATLLYSLARTYTTVRPPSSWNLSSNWFEYFRISWFSCLKP